MCGSKSVWVGLCGVVYEIVSVVVDVYVCVVSR